MGANFADFEPFYRTIFASPEDDLPRLVFADFLDETGDSFCAAWAMVIRAGCDFKRDNPGSEMEHLEDGGVTWTQSVQTFRFSPGWPDKERIIGPDRGFQYVGPIEVDADLLADADAFRKLALEVNPHWYGATRLKVTGGRVTTPAQVATLFTSPVTERVKELDLSGIVTESSPTHAHPVLAPEAYDLGLCLDEYIDVRPVITVRMVEVLAKTREARRLTFLDLRNNELDNDALRALAQSPYLHRLEHLALCEGNRFKGRVWQQVHERFGQDIIS